MDFKSLIQKIESLDDGISTPKAPELPKSIRLDEDVAAIQFLAGTKTLNEATEIVEKKLTKAEKEKKEEVVKSMKKDKEGFKERYGKRGEEVMHATATKVAKKKAEGVESDDEAITETDDMKVGDKKTTHKGGTIEKTKTGIKHSAGPGSYGGSKSDDDEEDDEPKSKKAKKESIDAEQFKSKFMQMVEAAKKKDKKVKEAVFVKPGAKERLEKEKQDKAADEKRRAESPGVSLKKKPMGEAAKPDFLDVDKDGNKKEPMKKAAADKGGDKKDGKKGMSAAQEKYFGKKNESKMMPKGKKRPVKESVEQPMSFRDMMKLVVESGGQQQIDPLDKALFSWAERVAKNKLGEGMKAEVYAGMVYERMGGRFEMYDTLRESRKKVNESRVQLDEGMLDKVKSVLMAKLAPKLSDQEKSKMKAAAEKVLGKSEVSSSDFTLDNIKAISKALGAKPSTASESIEEGPMDVLGKMAGDAGKKVGDFFGQKKVDPKSGKGTIGSVDAWHPDATLGEKLASLTGILGGTAATIAGFFGGPAWLIIPGILALMFLSQVGGTKD